MATAAQQRAQAAAAAAITRAQAHIRQTPPVPDDNPADTYITPTVARTWRLDLEQDRRHAR